MQPGLGFLLFLLLTLLWLGLAVWTGLKHRRKVHLVCVLFALTSLGIAIYFAEKLGDHLDLENAGSIVPIHLTLAKVATFAYLLPLGTGIRTWFRPEARRLHFWCAMLALVLTVLAFITGTMMWLAAEPLPVPSDS